MGPESQDDDALLAEIAEATRRAGEPTPTMAAAAEAAYAWRTVDAELAALTYDSAADEAVLVRDAATRSRQLVFEGEGLAVELELSPAGVVGQLVPPAPGTVALLGPDGEVARVEADDLGCFRFEEPPRGPVRLRCAAGGHDVVTDWVSPRA